MVAARRASRRRSVLIVIVLTTVTLITLDTRNGRSGPIGAIGRAAHTVVGPVQGLVDDVAGPVSDWWHGVSDAGHLKSDNRRLRQQVAALQGKERQADLAIQDDAVLKKYLALQNSLLAKSATAQIVGRDPGNFDPTLTIDKGTESGIAVDMAVISPEGLVGRVIEVWRGGAKVRVLTDPTFAVGVQTPGHPGAPATTGAASGQVGSHDLIVQFDQGTKVAVNDVIVTSPMSTLFPPGIPVGSVATVTEQPGGTGIVATVHPFVDIGGLQYVTVLEWVPGQGPAFATTTTTSTTTSTLPGSTTSTTRAGH